MVLEVTTTSKTRVRLDYKSGTYEARDEQLTLLGEGLMLLPPEVRRGNHLVVGKADGEVMNFGFVERSRWVE